jgi:hypothetical protein
MLSDPRAALADQNDVVTALTGLGGIARIVRGLAAGPPSEPAGAADDLVHLLLGLVSLGDAVERLACPLPEPPDRPEPAPRRWLR